MPSNKSFSESSSSEKSSLSSKFTPSRSSIAQSGLVKSSKESNGFKLTTFEALKPPPPKPTEVKQNLGYTIKTFGAPSTGSYTLKEYHPPKNTVTIDDLDRLSNSDSEQPTPIDDDTFKQSKTEKFMTVF